MSCCHHIHWLLQRAAEGEQFYHRCELGPMWLELSCCSDPIDPVLHKKTLFLQNYTCLLQTGYCYIFTYLGVVGEALINDSYSEQQLFKLVWAHCTTYP